MDDPGTLVVGASQAGLQIAATLRELGYQAPITMVGAETHAPYQRPPLSKELLLAGADPESFFLRNDAWYAENGIDLVLGERVRELTMTGDSGAGTARTDNGRELTFSRLALATGARNRRLDLPGAELGGILTLRELDDALAIRDALGSSQRVVIVGGGFIGLEIAAAARAQGAEVTVVEAADRLISRAVAPVVSEFYRAAHTRRGTTVMLQTGVDGFEDDGAGRVSAVRLADGRELPADLVVIGVGVIPNIRLGEQIGLAFQRGGIVVDSCGRTTRPGVVAAGDCTVQPHPLGGAGMIHLESVPNAVAQGVAAAAALVGRPEPVTAVPWFWSYQGDLKLQIAGLSYGYDQLVVRGDPDSEKFSVLYYAEGRLLAVDAVNNPMDYMLVRKLLGGGGTIPADAAADGSVPLKQLVATPA
jgi:3-phenylpropionate/trans-cinnamate dioxygenase ferredoxin reductase component